MKKALANSQIRKSGIFVYLQVSNPLAETCKVNVVDEFRSKKAMLTLDNMEKESGCLVWNFGSQKNILNQIFTSENLSSRNL